MTTFGDIVYQSGGVPVSTGLGMITGSVFFVDSSTGLSSNDGKKPTTPLATIAQAEAKCTADKGDYIIVMPGHAESVTATIVLDTSCVTVVGLGNGKKRPNLTQATSSSDNVVELAAANITLKNIYFTGSTTGTSEVFIDVQAAGDNCIVENCVFEQNTKNLEAITIASGANDTLIQGCTFIGAAAGADAGIVIEGASLRTTIRDCHFNYISSSGVDDACIEIESGVASGVLIENCSAIGLADGDCFVMPNSDSVGLVAHCSVHTADATDMILPSNVLGVIESYAVETGTFSGGATDTYRPIATPAA